jgi:hypothetical protein
VKRDPATPAARPTRPNWDKCTALTDATKAAIAAIEPQFEKLDQAARDQVRIVRSDTELARALISEISCSATKRLEKILALKLCRSRTLYDALAPMIRGFVAPKGELDQVFAEAAPSSKLQYIPYYFRDLATPLVNSAPLRLYFFRALSATMGIPPGTAADAAVKKALSVLPTTGVSPANQTLVATAIGSVWLKLPPPIRCAILLNDLKTNWYGSQRSKTSPIINSSRVTLSLGDAILANPGSPGQATTTVTITESATTFPPDFVDKTFGFAFSWSRDEEAYSTWSYRALLCPLWGGPSGHVISAFAFWERFGGTLSDPAAISLSLFALWRLYYDKRISAVHTLVESIEQTWTYVFDRSGQRRKGVKLPLWAAPTSTWAPDLDAFSQLKARAVNGTLNPFLVISTLETGYRNAMIAEIRKKNGSTYPVPLSMQYDWLLGEINRLRHVLANDGFWVPQWTWDIAGATGLAVISIAPLYQQIVAGTAGKVDNHAIQTLISEYVGPPSLRGARTAQAVA